MLLLCIKEEKKHAFMLNTAS